MSSTLLVYTRAWIRQIKNIVMMTKEGSTKIVNVMTPGTGSYAKVWSCKTYK